MLDLGKSLGEVLSGWQRLPIVRQLLLIVGLSACIAGCFYVVLWSMQPSYEPLYANLSPKETQEVVNALQQSDIQFKLGSRGAILVDPERVYEAKMFLASKDLPSRGEAGWEILERPQQFGTSQIFENTKLRLGLEGELARTITTIQAIRTARIHLAIPKDSLFVKSKEAPSASVLVEIKAGHELDIGQIKSIINLVASSVPGLSQEHVSLVDQYGRLLSSGTGEDYGFMNAHMEIERNIERTYGERIENLLTPIVGIGRVRAQVTAEMDFSEEEETSELYQPKSSVVINEKTLEEHRVGSSGSGGIPGTLTPTPPDTSNSAPTPPASDTTNKSVSPVPMSNKTQSSRNYEVDKSVKHKKQSIGHVKRLNVAVVLDDKVTVDDKGKETRTAFTEKEIDDIKAIVRDSVGFDESRGDKITVISRTFIKEPMDEVNLDLPFWKEHWFKPLVKQALAGLFFAIAFFVVFRPLLRNLTELKNTSGEILPAQHAQMKAASFVPGTLNETDNALKRVGQMIEDDPKRVAKVVMNWVGSEDE